MGCGVVEEIKVDLPQKTGDFSINIIIYFSYCSGYLESFWPVFQNLFRRRPHKDGTLDTGRHTDAKIKLRNHPGIIASFVMRGTGQSSGF